MPQMGYDTKTDRLTDCQSQCNSDSDSGRRRSPDCFKLSDSSAESGYEIDASLRGCEPGCRGTSTVGRRYLSAR
jgi:hypothetical protein